MENLPRRKPRGAGSGLWGKGVNAYLQYVDLKLEGAAIQRHRVAIPPNIQKLGGAKDLEGRLKTTFDLIEKGGKLSSKALEDSLNEIRKNYTPSLGKDHGRVVLKAAKPHLEEKLKTFRTELEKHQETVNFFVCFSRLQLDYILRTWVIRQAPDVHAAADAARGEKCLFNWHNQAILPSNGRPLKECRIGGYLP